MDQLAKFERFRALHQAPGAFVVANAWDAGSARLLTAAGFAALATTSAGYAYAHGLRDSAGALSRRGVLQNAAEIAAVTDLPVSADLEDGFGPAPEDCAETLRLALAAGLADGSIEDATGDSADPIFPFEHAVERVRAAAEAVRGQPFLLTARAESFLWGRPDLDDTIARLQAFADAGADVLFAPGLRDLAAIRRVCASIDRPVNVVMGLTGARFTVAELAESGVKRISLGGSLFRAGFGAVQAAARQILTEGRFDYAASAMPDAEVSALMAERRLADRRD